MTNYEIRVTQVTRDYYRVEADNPKHAEEQPVSYTHLRAHETR